MRTTLLILVLLGCQGHGASTKPSPSTLGVIDALDVVDWALTCPTAHLTGGGPSYELTCGAPEGDVSLRFEARTGCIEAFEVEGADEPSVVSRLADFNWVFGDAKARDLRAAAQGDERGPIMIQRIPRSGEGERVIWWGHCPISRDSSAIPSPFGAISPGRVLSFVRECASPLQGRPWTFGIDIICPDNSEGVGWQIRAYSDGRIGRVRINAPRERELRDRALSLIPKLVPERYFERFESSLLAHHGDVVPTWETVVSIVRPASVTRGTWIVWMAEIGL